MALVRTTIDLPDELHSQARSLARDSQRSLSEVVADLIRRGLRTHDAAEITRSTMTGLPTLDIGTTITTETVRELEDEA